MELIFTFWLDTRRAIDLHRSVCALIFFSIPFSYENERVFLALFVCRHYMRHRLVLLLDVFIRPWFLCLFTFLFFEYFVTLHCKVQSYFRCTVFNFLILKRTFVNIIIIYCVFGWNVSLACASSVRRSGTFFVHSLCTDISILISLVMYEHH